MTVAAKMQRESRASWPDDRLVAECLQGDEKAWSALVDKYKNLIFSIPIKLGLYDDAADIFQAVCLDLLTDLPRLREPSALPKWLMQTCYHKCLQCRRRAERHVALAEEDAELPPVNGSPSALPGDLLVQLELRLVPIRRLRRNSASPQAPSDLFADAVWQNLNSTWKTWGSK